MSVVRYIFRCIILIVIAAILFYPDGKVFFEVTGIYERTLKSALNAVEKIVTGNNSKIDTTETSVIKSNNLDHKTRINNYIDHSSSVSGNNSESQNKSSSQYTLKSSPSYTDELELEQKILPKLDSSLWMDMCNNFDNPNQKKSEFCDGL